MLSSAPGSDLVTKLSKAESAFKNSIDEWLAAVYPTKPPPPFTASLSDELLRNSIIKMSECQAVDIMFTWRSDLEVLRRKTLGSRAVNFLQIAVHDYGFIDVETLVDRIQDNFDKLIDMRDSLWSLKELEAEIKDS
jgi:hypothetical protein